MCTLEETIQQQRKTNRLWVAMNIKKDYSTNLTHTEETKQQQRKNKQTLSDHEH